MKLDKLLYLIGFLIVLDMATLAYSIGYGGYPPSLPSGGDPTSYKILYIHVPIAWVMYFSFTVTMVSSILFLVRGTDKYDVLALSSVHLGIIYGFSAIVSGMLWANAVWGEPWNWDPRETSTLMLLLAYLGYVALRGSISDVDRAKVISAAYAVAAFVTLPLSYFSAIVFRSLHEQLPSQPVTSGMLSILGVRVTIVFLVYLLILYSYYVRGRGG